MIRIPILHPGKREEFPALETALGEPNGLLAAGGDLSEWRLLEAYRRGIFPWFSQGEPILWWSPDPRLVFDTAMMHVPRRLRRELKHCAWTLRADSCFADVMQACAAPRPGQRGTWISPAMLSAYARLHERGYAHSIEVFEDHRLVGGIYGVAIGRMFFGESMFSHKTNGSKVALLGLAALLRGWDWPLIDAQVSSDHLFTLGGIELSRRDFSARIARLTDMPGRTERWIGALDRVRLDEL